MNRKTGVLLLDVNVLVALAIRDHPERGKAKLWFRSMCSNGFSECAITQSGLIRISSNPGIYKVRFFHEDALVALRSLTGLPEHEFWPMDVNYETAVAALRHRITGYEQTTDANLLGRWTTTSTIDLDRRMRIRLNGSLSSVPMLQSLNSEIRYWPRTPSSVPNVIANKKFPER